MIIRAAPIGHIAWLASRADISPSQEIRAIEAVDSHGRIHGMVGFDGWTGNAAFLSIALDNPSCLRHLVHPGFDYVFNQANRGVALVAIKSTNERSIRLGKKLGMREVTRIRDGFEVGVDIVVMEMRREECRWLQQDRKVA